MEELRIVAKRSKVNATLSFRTRLYSDFIGLFLTTLSRVI